MAMIAACAAVLLIPALAGAGSFPGKTRQGEVFRLETNAAGKVKFAGLRWNSNCNGRYRIHRAYTGIVPLLDISSKDRFVDRDRYSLDSENGVRSFYKYVLKGRRVNADRWSGTFFVRAILRKGGRKVDRCVVRNLTWTARAK